MIEHTAGFGAALQRRRRAVGLSQEQLALQVGCAPVTIEKLEMGDRRPSLPFAQRLAEVLGLADDAVTTFVEMAVPEAGPGLRLPAPATAMIGREAELSALIAMLQGGARLVTVTGPAGVGKTRLALEAAATLAGEAPDGVCFVALDPLTDPGQLAEALCHAIGVAPAADESPEARLRALLARRRLCLVADNFEHIVEAAPLLGALLRDAPGLRLLVTSRVPLRLAAEQVLALAPLAPPPADDLEASPAARLFLARARAVAPGLSLDAEDRAAVAAICRRLDGLPLAIELAAARTSLLPPRALLARLERSLDLPGAAPVDLPARQRTLRAAVAWSYDLLSPAARALLPRLGVFAGGCSLGAAAAVGFHDVAPGEREDQALVALDELCRHSLLQNARGPDGEPRFRLLDTIAVFARARLAETGEAPALEAAHAAFYLDLAESAAPHLKGPHQRRWADLLEEDRANLRAAFATITAQGAAAPALRLVVALWHFWLMRGTVGEASLWAERALALRGAPALLRGRALTVAGSVVASCGDTARAAGLLAEARMLLEPLGHLAALTEALNTTALVALQRNERERAAGLLERSAALARAASLPHEVAWTAQARADIARCDGDRARAVALYSEAAAGWRALGNEAELAWSYFGIASAALDAGDLAEAQAYALRSLELHRAVGATAGCACLEVTLSDVARRTGDLPEAEARARAALELSRSHGFLIAEAESLEALACARSEQGDYPGAVALWAEAAAGWASFPASAACIHPARDSYLAAARAVLGDEPFEAMWAAAGGPMPPPWA